MSGITHVGISKAFGWRVPLDHVIQVNLIGDVVGDAIAAAFENLSIETATIEVFEDNVLCFEYFETNAGIYFSGALIAAMKKGNAYDSMALRHLLIHISTARFDGHHSIWKPQNFLLAEAERDIFFRWLCELSDHTSDQELLSSIDEASTAIENASLTCQ